MFCLFLAEDYFFFGTVHFITCMSTVLFKKWTSMHYFFQGHASLDSMYVLMLNALNDPNVVMVVLTAQTFLMKRTVVSNH